MVVRYFLLMGCLLLLHGTLAAQLLKGKIYDVQSDSVLAGVTILNVNTQVQAQSNRQGSYAIAASEKDKLVISYIGYKPDTIVVMFYMLVNEYDMALRLDKGFLSAVTVYAYNNYQVDSLNRREDYRHIYDKPMTKLAGGNTPSSGVGITFSPVSYFSAEQKQQRKLKKRLLHDEEQAYVDYCFPRSYVQKITSLQGDSLQTFMFRYRPSYAFCRQSNREDMLVYINAKLKLFMQHK